MKSFSPILLLLSLGSAGCLTSVLGSVASATVVRYDFVGTVFEMVDPAKVWPNIRPGDQVRGFLSYDTSWRPDGQSAGFYVDMPGPFVGVGLQVEGKGGESTEFLPFPDQWPLNVPFGWIDNDLVPTDAETPYDSIELFQTMQTPPGLIPGCTLGVALQGPSGSLQSALWPESLTLDDWPIAQAFFNSGDGKAWINANLHTFTRAALPPVVPGDADGDGRVDLNDFGILKTHFGDTHVTPSWGDFSGDNTVGLADFGILKDNFGRSIEVCEPPSIAIAQLAILVITLQRLLQRPFGRMGHGWIALLCAVTCSMIGPNDALGQNSTFRGLGVSPGYDSSAATGLSANGLVVLGVNLTQEDAVGFVESSSGRVYLDDFPEGAFVSSASAAADDGTRIVGHGSKLTGSSIYAATWTSDGAIQAVRFPGQPVDWIRNGEITDISPDGRFMVGGSLESNPGGPGFIWSDGKAAEISPPFPRGPVAVSDDGNVVAGYSWHATPFFGEPYLWHRSEGTKMLGMPTLGESVAKDAFASDISGDGHVVIGRAYTSQYEEAWAWRWTQGAGYEPLASPIAGQRDLATSVSYDGTVILGMSVNADFIARPFVWDALHHTRPLEQVFIHDYGLREQLGTFDLSRMPYDSSVVLSNDAVTICGTAFRDGRYEGWVAHLIEPQRGDANFDGRVDLQDFGVLKLNFGKGVWRDEGDFNDDERIDLTDFGILKENFGRLTTVASEPGTGVLAILAAGAVLLSNRRTCRSGRSESRVARYCSLLFALVYLVSTSRPASGQGSTFQGLGVAPGYDYSRATGLSANGQYVLGFDLVNLGTPYQDEMVGFVESSEGRVVLGSFSNDHFVSWPRSITDDGGTVVGHGTEHGYYDELPATWSKDGSIRSVRELANGEMYDVSPDGRFMVGGSLGAGNPAGPSAIWSDGSFQKILPGGPVAVSDNGDVVAGYSWIPSGNEPYLWHRAEGAQMLGLPLFDGIAATSPRTSGLSGDGNVVIGTATKPGGGTFGWKWTDDGGYEYLGSTESGYEFLPTSLSSTGAVLVGTAGMSGTKGQNRPYLWSMNGTHDLEKVLRDDYGLRSDLQGWSFDLGGFPFPLFASNDGRTIAGTSQRDGRNEAWVAHLVEPLPGDGNFDGRVDLQDFGILKVNFGNGVWRDQGDFNDDERIDLTDFGILKDNFGTTAVVVPEPQGLSLALLGGAFVMGALRGPCSKRRSP